MGSGSFREPKEPLTYAENQLAGPWAALNLMRYLGALHEKMSLDGHLPEKIVVGGRIGELFYSYPESTNAHTLGLICEKAGIPLDAVTFSALNPIRREAAMTQACVDSPDVP